MRDQMQSPPLTPLHTRRTSQSDRSPTLSYRSHLRRRTNSFSSNHDRSPITPRSQHRFSNASAYSGQLGVLGDELDTVGGAEGGLGNLADELDQLSDEDYDDGTILEEADSKHTYLEAIRDSGVDVSYNDTRRKQEQDHIHRPEEPPDDWPASLDGVADDLARVVKASDAASDDKTIAQYRISMVKLLPLDDQIALENSTQRLNTSTNSMATHITQEAKAIQTLGVSLFSPFGLRGDILDYQALEESLPLFDDLIQNLAQPEQAFLQGIQKLTHETQNIIQTNLSLSDTMQEFNRSINDAARHLREARKQVDRYRQEQEEAEAARIEISRMHDHDQYKTQRAANVCKDIVSGFETFCDSIRQNWSDAMDAAPAA